MKVVALQLDTTCATYLECFECQQVLHLVITQTACGLRQHVELLQHGASQGQAAQQALS